MGHKDDDDHKGHKKHDKPIIYMIRHGEKPPKLPDGDDPIGLSSIGEDRASALPSIFGKGSQYNLGLIMAQHPKKDGKRARPYETIKPLYQSLEPDIKLNTSVDRDDSKDAAKTALDWEGPGNVLICWEHGQLEDIAKAIGVKNAQPYPGDRYDIIWTIESPYTEINTITSEHVPGLDNAYASEP